MIIRFVRMTFQPEKVNEFLEFLENYLPQIRNFEGCTYLEILRDIDNPSVLMTHSHWVSADALENYRKSELFSYVWSNTKIHFSDKPIAFSMKQIALVK